MTTPQKKRPTSPDLLGSEKAIKRAAQRARNRHTNQHPLHRSAGWEIGRRNQAIHTGDELTIANLAPLAK